MELHPLAAEFAGVADAYERGRYEYDPAVVGAFAAVLGLSPGDRVLDLAAGTGKLTRALVDWGLDVTALEPQSTMREVLAARIGSERALEGVAEAIPAPDRAFEAVTVGDGFHWFNAERALAEIRRVLVPGGGLALLATMPDFSGASWADELGAIMERLRPEHPFFDGPSWRDAVHAAEGWSELRQIRVTTPQPARPERMVDFLNSMSWVAAMPDDQRSRVLAQVTALVEAGETPAEIDIHVIIGLASVI